MAVIEKLIELGTLGTGVRKKSLAKRSNGEYWVVYFKDSSSPSEIRNTLAYTTDNGDTWELISLFGGSNATGPVGICIDVLDNVFAFYRNYKDVYYKIVPGGSYIPGTEYICAINPVLISNAGINSIDTISFIKADYGAIGHDLKQIYKVSGYNTWYSDTVESATAIYNNILLAVDSNDNLHTVYVKGYPGYYGLTYRLGLNNPPYHTKIWQTPEIIDTESTSNHWGSFSLSLDINESPILTADNHGYFYKSGGIWYLEDIGTFILGSISSSRDGSLNTVARVSPGLKYKYKNGDWSNWNLITSDSGASLNSMLWDTFPKTAGIPNNIPLRGSVAAARKTDGIYFYLIDTVWKYPSVGEGFLRGWQTRIRQGGTVHRGAQTSWYRPNINTKKV